MKGVFLLTPKSRYWVVWAIIIVFYLLRHDFWNWGKIEPFLFGMPVALWYHILYSILSTGVVYLMVKYVWPDTPEEALEREEDKTLNG
jgi:hypothetical protein